MELSLEETALLRSGAIQYTASSSSSSSSQRKIRYVHWGLVLEEQVLVLYQRDGREATTGPGSTPSVYLALEFSHRSKIPSTKLLFHTLWLAARPKAAWWPWPAGLASEKHWAPLPQEHLRQELRQDPDKRGPGRPRCPPKAFTTLKLRPWGTRVPLAPLTSGTEPRCCTGPPAQGTSPPSRTPLRPRSWTAGTSWPAAADTATH